MLDKTHLIDEITRLNRSARAEFLVEFDEEELQQYLSSLEAIWSDFQDQFYRLEETVVAELEELVGVA